MKQRILKLKFITQHKQLSNNLKWQLFFSQGRYDSQLVCYSAVTSPILLRVRLQDCSHYSSFVQLFFSLSLLTNKQSYQQLIQQIELTEKWLHQSLISILQLLISCEVFRKTFSQRHSYLTSPTPAQIHCSTLFFYQYYLSIDSSFIYWQASDQSYFNYPLFLINYSIAGKDPR